MRKIKELCNFMDYFYLADIKCYNTVFHVRKWRSQPCDIRISFNPNILTSPKTFLYRGLRTVLDSKMNSFISFRNLKISLVRDDFREEVMNRLETTYDELGFDLVYCDLVEDNLEFQTLCAVGRSERFVCIPLKYGSSFVCMWSRIVEDLACCFPNLMVNIQPQIYLKDHICLFLFITNLETGDTFKVNMERFAHMDYDTLFEFISTKIYTWSKSNVI